MLNIAVCDDDKALCDELKNMLVRYGTEFSSDIQCECFESGTQLLSGMLCGVYYDLLFLDIVMPGLNGIDTAKEIRKDNTASHIIFLTTSPEFALESYSVSADNYIIKPISYDGLCTVLNKFRAQTEETHDNELILRDKNSFTRVVLHNIEYVEAQNHFLYYHLRDGQVISCRQNLSEIESTMLSHRRFIKPHRSYIINMNGIEVLDGNMLKMRSGCIVPVSRVNAQSISDEYLKYKLEGGLRNG